MSLRNRFYCNAITDVEPSGVAQLDECFRGRDRSIRIKIAEPILRLAQEEYDRQHPGQPYERMQEHGGLSILEIIALLADHVNRLKEGK